MFSVEGVNMTDREERQHVIEVLKSWDGYFIGYTSDEVQEALRYAIASIETDLKYDLLYEETSGQADKPTTKNDLAVDCISRADVLKLMQDNWHTHNGDWAMQESMDDIRALPAVTSIRPKGHWIEQIDHEENCRTLICSNCDRPALHDEDSIWKHKFCPHCGADMRGEEE